MPRRTILVALVAAFLSLVPARAAHASWNLTGFTGPVILTWYNSCYNTMICVDATLATGQSSGSAAWFTRVLRFDVDFNLGPEGMAADVMWAGFEERNLINGAVGPMYLTITGEPYMDPGSTQPFFPLYQPGHILVWYSHTFEEPNVPEGITGQAVGIFDPTHVTVTPEPATMALLATGLGGIAMAHRRRTPRRQPGAENGRE